jgi:hypothetical protein
MKLLVFISLFSLVHFVGFGQKDKTTNWQYEEIIGGKLVVTKNSTAYGAYNYEGTQIIADREGKMRWKITPFQNSLVQINVNSITKVDDNIDAAKKYEFIVKKSDTVRLYLITQIKDRSDVLFYYDYIYGEPLVTDTAKIILKKDPKEAFEQLLADARFYYAHLFYHNEKDVYQDIQYPAGLFFNQKALKDRKWVKQYTAFAVDKATAAASYEVWNKKVKAWLKDYNITRVTQTGDQYNVETNYIKLSATGFPLFKVTVFISQEEKFNSGVIISKT